MAIDLLNDLNIVGNPTLLLQNRNCETIGVIANPSGLKYKDNFNSANELSFTTYKFIDNEINPLWDKLKDLKIVSIPDYKVRFQIEPTTSEENNLSKSKVGTELCQAELSQISLRNIYINTSEDILNNDYDENLPRNLIKNSRGNVKSGFFKNMNTDSGEYGEFTLKSKRNYTTVNLSGGFVCGCRDYAVGEKYTWSYDIMYTAWNFPTGSSREEFWMGQRYTNAPSGENATGAWRSVTAHSLPVVGQNGCELNKWYHNEVTKTIPEQASSNVNTVATIQFYNPNADVEASFTARIKNVKLEKSSTATPWTPAPEDDASFYDNVIYDTSGYNNNGSVTDSTCPTWSSDTPRYKGSYMFNGNNQYLKFQNPISSAFVEFSISCWIKFNNVKKETNNAICTMRSGVGTGVALFRIGNNFRLDDNTQSTFSDYTISANEWIHVVVTRSSSCKNLYINGVLKQTKNTVGDMKLISNVGTIGVSSQSGNGISNSFYGKLSDFRIYATALSDSDILELYQSSTSVDNNGNLMLAGEVIEE